jgi:hypothetical protein
MIGYFPDPYPDELFYSLCARYSDRMQYPGKKDVFEELFGRLIESATRLDLPLYLGSLASRLPPGHSCRQVELLINRHTLLPFYAPFLPVEQFERFRVAMQGRIEKSVPLRPGLSGGRMPQPEWLRFCPRCVQEDRMRYGECYWHRVHQVPGVHLCLTHMVLLENSPVRLRQHRLQHKFTCAEPLIPDRLSCRPLPSGPGTELLLVLAREAAWLLEHEPISVGGPAQLRQRYRSILYEQGLASYRGMVKLSQLREAFQIAYPTEVLKLLAVELDLPNSPRGWLARLIHTGDSYQKPVEHLLLVHFLGYTTASLLARPAEPQPFGPPPWPCLNAASDHYHQGTIGICQITVGKTGRPVGTFACSCGFTYVRWGPDHSVTDRLRADHYQAFGPLWEATLTTLWADSATSIHQISQRLGLSRKTIVRCALRLGLPFPPPGSRQGRNQCPLKPTTTQVYPPSPETVQTYQTKWLEVIKAHPEADREFLQHQYLQLYRWLRRHDSAWLEAHLPPRRLASPRPRPVQVDWPKRDQQLAQDVRAVVEQLKNRPGRPVRITLHTICREIHHFKSLRVQLKTAPLPRTAQAMTEVIESREMAALRRIQWAVARYAEEGVTPFRTELMKRAGVTAIHHWPAVKAALETGLEQLQRLP